MVDQFAGVLRGATSMTAGLRSNCVASPRISSENVAENSRLCRGLGKAAMMRRIGE